MSDPINHQLELADPRWRTLLHAMNPMELFSMALRSRNNCRAVVEYLSTCSPSWLIEDNIIFPVDGLRTLPGEVRQMIVEHMPLLCRIHFGQTSKAYRSLCALVMRLSVADLIVANIGLSGSAIPWLILYPRQSSKAFTPNGLDFYVPRSQWENVRSFFGLGTAYVYKRSMPPDYSIPSVRAVVGLKTRSDDPRTINLMCCADENPLAATTQFHSTCVVGCVTADRAWFPYANLTTLYISILNRKYVQFAGALELERALLVIRKYQARGFAFHVDYPEAHTCGSNPNCPCTVRFSNDGGCSSMCLSSVKSGLGQIEEDRPTLWSWHGVGCQASKVRKATDVNDFTESAWELIARRLIDYPTDKPVSQILSLPS
ncbi:hypothetical protein B0H12DRAFT_1069870 [Mycena haematopus]|nr:hypothetical protein B0H12DRAFT_1069870 [Mycena haematopus]